MAGESDKRIKPKPIGAIHRSGCTRSPCMPIEFGRPWAYELVIQYAPQDTVRKGGPQWAADAIRARPGGGPATVAEQKLVDDYPVKSGGASSSASLAAPSEIGEGESKGDEDDDSLLDGVPA